MVFDAVPVAAAKKGAFRIECKPKVAESGVYISVTNGTPRFTPSDLTFLKTVIEKGKLKPVIDRYYSLEQLAEAHAYVETWHKRGNIIVSIGDT